MDKRSLHRLLQQVDARLALAHLRDAEGQLERVIHALYTLEGDDKPLLSRAAQLKIDIDQLWFDVRNHADTLLGEG